MNRKCLALAFFVLVLFSLTACGGSNQQNNDRASFPLEEEENIIDRSSAPEVPPNTEPDKNSEPEPIPAPEPEENKEPVPDESVNTMEDDSKEESATDAEEVTEALPEDTALSNISPEPIDPPVIVYVSSRSHTVHSVADCSGMKKYKEMTKSEADAKGYKYCTNCW